MSVYSREKLISNSRKQISPTSRPKRRSGRESPGWKKRESSACSGSCARSIFSPVFIPWRRWRSTKISSVKNGGELIPHLPERNSPNEGIAARSSTAGTVRARAEQEFFRDRRRGRRQDNGDHRSDRGDRSKFGSCA